MMKAKRFQVTGNPVRGNIGQLQKAEALRRLDVTWKPDDTILLVTGGSQGARSINKAMLEALPVLLGKAPDGLNLRIIHQTGKKLYEETMNQLSSEFINHPNYMLRPYYPEMATVLGAADMAVCRAGSLSLSEMYLCEIPTVLIPYPYAAADHQRKNALASVESGASRMILDSECTGASLIEQIRSLVQHPEQLELMRTSCQKLAHPNATQDIIEILKQYSVAHQEQRR
jgi:UDP-N-acetylglucosamine--N-acetylmuramyl-(pentapeptide) pyrophosphoryl-undecaprenol N-acetylglucosamine transferase